MLVHRTAFILFIFGSFFVIVYVFLFDEERLLRQFYEYNEKNIEGDIQDLVQAPPLEQIFNCGTNPLLKSFKQRGKYLVFYNYIKPNKIFHCTESITLTAPADFRFLDNVVPLVKVWKGPISIALYAPGYDFFTTLASIAYLRNCQDPLVKELVTFHIFFDEDHLPLKKDKTPLFYAYEDQFDCTKTAPFLNVNEGDIYKVKNNLLYPINVARNIARESAQTYLVFPSDIELFPTPNFISKFLNLVTRKPNLFVNGKKTVYVLPIFEILETETIPQNKTELQKMYETGRAILFHETICDKCHKVPKGDKWIQAKETEGINIFTIGKRQGLNQIWEPFFICTNNEPLWDERLTWEGQSNKMSQAYSLCLLDYSFAVLDNAFVTHKPGIKKRKVQEAKHQAIINTSLRILQDIAYEQDSILGENLRRIMAPREPQLYDDVSGESHLPSSGLNSIVCTVSNYQGFTQPRLLPCV